jgi:hypothetical protein
VRTARTTNDTREIFGAQALFASKDTWKPPPSPEPPGATLAHDRFGQISSKTSKAGRPGRRASPGRRRQRGRR